MAKVSVIMPAFNAARSVAWAISSALEQTVADIEVLVIDDASTDLTAAVVEEIAARDPRVRLIRNPVNGGPGVARNFGLDAARGEWVALLDADDAFLPH